VSRTPSGAGSHLFHLPTRFHAGRCSLVAVRESLINVIYDTAGDAKSRVVGPGGLVVNEEDANAIHSVGGVYLLLTVPSAGELAKAEHQKRETDEVQFMKHACNPSFALGLRRLPRV
jgi:hypothetical protein